MKCAHEETECEAVVYSKQFDKRLPNCFTTGMWVVNYLRYSQSELTAIWR